MNFYDEASPMEIIPFAGFWKAALHTNLFVFENINHPPHTYL